MSEDILYQIAMTQLKGLGPLNLKRMLAHCKDPKLIFESPLSYFEGIQGLGKLRLKGMDRSAALKRAELELQYIHKNQIHPLFYTDKKFPQRLRHCEDGPVLLYAKGEADYNQQRVIAVVGTRNMTNYGKRIIEKLLNELKMYEVLVVSGLAHGVDVHAHHISMKLGLETVGVLGHGYETVYPAIHRGVAHKMVEKSGGLLTEFVSDMLPNRENFPKRNRVVAGMCDALIVVEAAEKGGALITAHIANSYNRDVFAVPGRIDDEFSEGCLGLIQQNIAQLITSGEDVVKSLNWDIAPKQPRQLELYDDIDENEKVVLDHLVMNQSVALDELAFSIGKRISELSPVLLSLELKGLVKMLPGNRCLKI